MQHDDLEPLSLAVMFVSCSQFSTAFSCIEQDQYASMGADKEYVTIRTLLIGCNPSGQGRSILDKVVRL